MRKISLAGLLSVAAVLLLASYFYLHDLNALSFWEDESWLAIAVSDGLPDVLTFSINNGVHPPLYFYLAWFYVRLAGDSEVALRWMGGLVTLVGLALTYRLGRLLYNHRAGYFAVLLAVGSIYLIYLTRLARQYTLFYTLCVLIAYAYWRWSKQPHKHRWLIVLGVAQVAALYTHYFSIWMAVTVGLHGLLTLRFRQTLKLAGVLILAGIAFAIWLPALQIQIQNSPEGGIGYAIRDGRIVLENFTDRIFNTNRPLGAALFILGAAAILLVRRWRAGLLLALWILTFGVMLFINERLPIYVDRNMLYLLPAFVLLYSIGLAWLTNLTRDTDGHSTPRPYNVAEIPSSQKNTLLRLGWIPALILAGLFIYSGVNNYATFWPTTQNWREAVQQMAEFARPGDVYVVDGEHWSMDYYLRRLFGLRLKFENMRAWTQNPTGENRIWLIDPGMAVDFEAIEALPGDMLQTRRIVVLPIVAELYQRPPEQPATVFGGQIALGVIPADMHVRAGETLVLDLWWRAERTPDTDYSAGILIMKDGVRIAGQDGGFDSGRIPAQALPVGAWKPDTRRIDIPADAAPGEYTVFVTVYDWRDLSRLPTMNEDPENLYPVMQITID